MSEATVIPLRPRGRQPRLHRHRGAERHPRPAHRHPASGADRDLLADIGLILARTGRPMVRARHIEARISRDRTGWPVARVDAEDTTVTVRQDPAGTGLLVEITTTHPAERDGLTVTLDGRRLHNPCPPGGDAA